MTAAVAAVAVSAALCCALYTYAAGLLRRRGDTWARGRDAVCWLGGAVLVCSVAVPWGSYLPPFTAHTVAHLGAGMVAPLLVVLARPVTLALRTVPVAVRRGLVALTGTGAVRFLVLPPVAAVIDVGGLWLLYRAPLPAGVHHSPLLYAHLFTAGTLFAFSVLALDPLRHRPGLPLRAGTLLAAAAAHSVLARSLWAAGPPGTAYTAADLHLASQLMYYGGDLVEIAAAVVMAHQWYRAEGRALYRYRRRTPSPVTAPVTAPVPPPPPAP
ncbi:cytochrome c oxidase assembly protein [Streptomyces poonensis]|uniref:Membrane protein n=1 Tax=Streptomyces poonensis TaxID=68255 RepID=A0A918PLK5_9ACTN|nr:cytochrome c oxidase assembly protein [Streptomyces poonensis]GGZ15316.1 membrane protein [Streptomyces poonensis]GLJ91482.1 membrane protein [Streptomyces poonensis]